MESWEEFPIAGRKVFKLMRETPGAGETMVMEKNFFVEKLLLGEPWAAQLSAEELAVYRERFCSPVSRIPTLAWPRQIPIKGTNGPVDILEAAEHWFKVVGESSVPKLFINAEPGFFSPSIVKKIQNWKNSHVSPPVKGVHFIQEESPGLIAKYLVEFCQGLSN